MIYKIFRSSINFSDNRYYTIKELDIVKISKRLFNKNIKKKIIYFIIDYKNLKLCGYIAKKNKNNIITVNKISFNDKNIKKLLIIKGGNNIITIKDKLLHPDINEELEKLKISYEFENKKKEKELFYQKKLIIK